MILNEYKNIIVNSLDDIVKEEENNIKKASEIVADTIKNKGLIYIFGCGHSGIISCETFYRAGGLGLIQPIFIEPLMLHESATESSILEKQSGYYETFKNKYIFTKNDCLITVSTSDKNAVPVEYTNYVKGLNVKTIGIYSKKYENTIIHNEINKHLHEICDVHIDNKAPYGDSCINIDGIKHMAPLSTITGSFIINSIIAEAVEICLRNKIDVPVFISGNIEGGSEYNKELTEELKKRVKHL